jgi:hypothetical protein
MRCEVVDMSIRGFNGVLVEQPTEDIPAWGPRVNIYVSR